MREEYYKVIDREDYQFSVRDRFFLDNLLEELEEILIMSDIGVETSTKIISNLRDRVKKEKLSDEKDVKIDVNIIVEYGSRIPDVAYEIQTRVKKSVENMTGLKVAEVNVHVQGVKTEKEIEEKEEVEEEQQ